MNKYTIGMIMGFLGAGLTLQATASQLEQAPLDASYLTGQAPIIFEYNQAGPAIIISEPVAASGIIKSICVSAEFTGKVSLAASANNGNSYVKIINGMPLSEGFIPGTQLRVKANVAEDSILKNLTISYTDSSGAKKSYRNLDLANYKYQKEIYISGGSEEVFNYPLKINVGSVIARSAKRDEAIPDIYFTAADGQTPLYYYLENEIAASPAAPRNDTKGVIASHAVAKQSRTFWVKVPQIPKEGAMIYMYYGVIAASPTAPRNDTYNDPTKVFPFFDDFTGASLNEEKWEIVPGLKKEYNVKDGYLQLKDCLVLSRNYKVKQGIIEFKAKAENNAGIQVLVRSKVSSQAVFPYDQIVYSSNYSGAEHTIAINDIAKLNVAKPIAPLTYYMYRAVINPTSILFERYSEDQQEKQAEIKFLDVGNYNAGNLGLKADTAAFNEGSIYFDWIRVRPYVEVEPKAVIASPAGAKQSRHDTKCVIARSDSDEAISESGIASGTACPRNDKRFVIVRATKQSRHDTVV